VPVDVGVLHRLRGDSKLPAMRLKLPIVLSQSKDIVGNPP
jgi:hypothetical protein